MRSTTLLYIATENGIVFFTATNQHWQLDAPMLMGKNVVDVAYQVDNPAIIYGAVKEYGIYYTTNNGQTWQQMLAVNAHSILLDKMHPNCLWVGIEPPGLYRSLDAGKTWQDLSETFLSMPDALDWTFPSPPYQARLSLLSLMQDNTILAGVQIGGLLRSSNGGDSWTMVDDILDEDIQALAIHPTDPTFCLLGTGDGIYCSRDGAHTWTEASLGVAESYIRDVLILANGICFAAASHTPPGNWVENATTQLYRSDTYAMHWQPITLASPENISAFARDVKNPEIVYIGTQSGAIYISHNQGQDWSKIAQAPSAINMILPIT